MKFKVIFKRNLSVLLACLFCLCSFSAGSSVSANASETVDPVINMGDSFLRYTSSVIVRNSKQYRADFGVVNDVENTISLTYKVSSNTTYPVETYCSFDYFGHNYGTLTITLSILSGTAYDGGGFVQVNSKPIDNYSYTVSDNKYVFIINGNIPSHFEIGGIFDKVTPEVVNSNNLIITLYSNAVFAPDYSNMTDDIINNQNQNTQDIIDNQKEQTNKISGFFSNLGDRIGGFFTELKDNLINGIKDLFVPTDQQITDFKDRTDKLLSDHLGVIYEAPNIMVDFIQLLADFEPLRSDNMNDYYIEFPSKNIYLNSSAENTIDIISESDNGGEVIPLIPDNTGQGSYKWTFGWLGEKPFSTFYSIYNAAIIFITIIGFCYYAMRKYNSIMEG